MANIQLTFFNAIEVEKCPKVAFSKYSDNEFIFVTKETETLKEMFLLMSEHFVLSQPLKIKEPIKTLRRKENLEKYKYNRIKNIILDLDQITTKEDYLHVIDYFDQNGYSCCLGKSRSWNGKDCFNIKGIIRTDLINDQNIIKTALTQIQVDLGSMAKVDLTIGNFTSYQAPSHSTQIILNKEKGKKFTDRNIHIKNVKETINNKIDVFYNNEVIDECLNIFNKLGYTPIKNSMNSNGSINFQHFSEVKSKGGFFWFSNQPLVMNHPNSSRTISIFNLFKKTEIGKKWLKDKTKHEQKKQLIKDEHNLYDKHLIVNERYLNFDDTEKKNMIVDFINSEKNVLKIKSAMGTAKSSGISLCVEEAHKRNLKVILITNRVSVAMDFEKKYNMMIYKDKDAWKEEKSLIVQFDSLHRFNIQNYDVVILDEFISLLFHHRSNLTTNSNINVVKFKILMENKKVLVADAFLTGYEDVFFKNRNISLIDNIYRDEVGLYEYTDENFFIETIIEKAKNTKKIITCSFTSNNIMKAVHLKLQEQGIKSVLLNAETPQYTKDLIYEKFKLKNHDSFEVLLYSPTLTVGVSNLNDVDLHFHYDSGMSADVISSLQMIKRSRNAKEIHYFVIERQFYYDTDVESINKVAETNVNAFYSNKNATLLIDVDYETGNLKLTELAKYINKIEAFYNITKNNHANAFKLLLNYQFKTDIKVINKEGKIDIKNYIKLIKDKEKALKLKILEDFTGKDFSQTDMDRLKNKETELTQDEKASLLIDEIANKFSSKMSNEDLLFLAKKQIETNHKYLSIINKYAIVNKIFKSPSYSKFLLSQTISEDISSLQNKNHIDFLDYTNVLSSKIPYLKKRYSVNEIKKIDALVDKGTKFLRFLRSIGYLKGEAKYYIDEEIEKFSKLI